MAKKRKAAKKSSKKRKTSRRKPAKKAKKRRRELFEFSRKTLFKFFEGRFFYIGSAVTVSFLPKALSNFFLASSLLSCIPIATSPNNRSYAFSNNCLSL